MRQFRSAPVGNRTEGVFVVDKPAGPTSFDIVRDLKRAFPGEKVGHGGSLDPFATGVLIILVGRATKHSSALLTSSKRYWGQIKLGEATYSMDKTGEVSATAPIPDLTPACIESVLKGFEGEWMQTPPMFSAKKIHGVRLYDLARQQIHVRRAPEPVQLYEVKFLNYAAGSIEFELFCSKGTYVRAFADEVAKRLGTVGHLAELRRLECGEFSLSQAVTPEALCEAPEKWLAAGLENFHKLLRDGKTLFPPVATNPTLTSFANAP